MPGAENGKLWINWTTIGAMLLSIAVFWFQFYPTIATESWVDKRIAEKALMAPITRDAELKLNNLRDRMANMGRRMERIENKLDLVIFQQKAEVTP